MESSREKQLEAITSGTQLRTRASDIWLLPNLITSYRGVAAVAILLACFMTMPRWAVLAVYFTGLVSDKADGFLARRLNKCSALGNKLDPIVDCMFAYALLLFLTRTTDFPKLILNVGLAMAGIVAVYVTARAMMGRIHFPNIPNLAEGKIMAVFFHATVIAYLFWLSFREFMFWASLAGGVLTVFSYLGRMYYHQDKA